MGTHPIFESDFDCLTDFNQYLARNMAKVRVCVIGGGPAGIMTVAAIKDHCDVVAFERANDLFGQWAGNTDEMTEKHYGSRHSSFYTGLWTNAPKESDMEVPNMPFKEAQPSYVEADVIREYLKEYVERFELQKLIKTFHNVEQVEWDQKTEKFTVKINDVDQAKHTSELFDFVIVATGHYNYPVEPKFVGEHEFTGEILHSHNFKNGANYKGKRVLCVGGSYSAEDICLQCWKNGAKYAHVSSRKPTGFGYPDWPDTVKDKVILKKICGSKVTFDDGTEEEYDVIIKCTGYIHKFDFLPERYSQMGGNALVPLGLYKQCIAMDNSKLWFIGMQNLVYSAPMFQLQAYLLRDTLTGKFKIPDAERQKSEWDTDKHKESQIASVHDAIQFQTDYVNELAELTNEAKIDAAKIFFSWFDDKQKSILKFREKNYASVHSGRKGETAVKWLQS